MRLLHIQKKPGSFRIVCAPDEKTKLELKSMVGKLEQKARAVCPEQVLHGFTLGKSPVTNAKAHVGYDHTLSFDLEDFFDTVGPQQLRGLLTKEEADKVLLDPGDGKGCRAMQGLPTSPAVANIAAAAMDRAILQAIHKSGFAIVYTRYADDLTFSFNALPARDWLKQEINSIVSRNGFKINKNKTHFQRAVVGRRVVTGVSVGETDVRAPRDVRRRLRAAMHQAKREVRGAASSARGLAEWCMMKSPRKLTEKTEQWRDTIKALQKHWKFKCVPVIPKEIFIKEMQDGDFTITHDPAYMIGMSNFTTGWASCTQHPSGGAREGAVAWFNTSGSSVAALLSHTVITHGGIMRRAMRARAIVHAFDGGTFGYDRLYGDPASVAELKAWLEARGFTCIYGIYAANALPFRTVRGIVPLKGARMYMDSLYLDHTPEGTKLCSGYKPPVRR